MNWDARIADGTLTHYATMPAPSLCCLLPNDRSYNLLRKPDHRLSQTYVIFICDSCLTCIHASLYAYNVWFPSIILHPVGPVRQKTCKLQALCASQSTRSGAGLIDWLIQLPCPTHSSQPNPTGESGRANQLAVQSPLCREATSKV